MQNSYDLSIYLNELNSIKKLLDHEKDLNCILENLDNYLDQLNCARKSFLLEEKNDSWSRFGLDLAEVRSKFLFKLNQSISQVLDQIQEIL